MNLICRQKQSIQQIGALFLLVIAAVLLSIGEGSSKGSSKSNADQVLFYGIIPVLVASVLSGLASALCQWASQVMKLLSCAPSIVKFSKLTTDPELVVSFRDRLRNTHHT